MVYEFDLMDQRERHLADPFRPSRRPFGCSYIQEAGSISATCFLCAAQQLCVASHILAAAFVSALVCLTVSVKPFFAEPVLRKLFIVLWLFFFFARSSSAT